MRYPYALTTHINSAATAVAFATEAAAAAPRCYYMTDRDPTQQQKQMH